MNEYSALKDSVLYSWAELSPGSFFLRLGGLWIVTFTVLAAPIAAASFNPGKVPTKNSSNFSDETWCSACNQIPEQIAETSGLS